MRSPGGGAWRRAKTNHRFNHGRNATSPCVKAQKYIHKIVRYSAHQLGSGTRQSVIYKPVDGIRPHPHTCPVSRYMELGSGFVPRVVAPQRHTAQPRATRRGTNLLPTLVPLALSKRRADHAALPRRSEALARPLLLRRPPLDRAPPPTPQRARQRDSRPPRPSPPPPHPRSRYAA